MVQHHSSFQAGAHKIRMIHGECDWFDVDFIRNSVVTTHLVIPIRPNDKTCQPTYRWQVLQPVVLR